MSNGCPVRACDPSPELDAAELTSVLGGKAAGSISLSAQGFPVPPRFVLPTALCET